MNINYVMQKCFYLKLSENSTTSNKYINSKILLRVAQMKTRIRKSRDKEKTNMKIVPRKDV